MGVMIFPVILMEERERERAELLNGRCLIISCILFQDEKVDVEGCAQSKQVHLGQRIRLQEGRNESTHCATALHPLRISFLVLHFIF